MQIIRLHNESLNGTKRDRENTPATFTRNLSHGITKSRLPESAHTKNAEFMPRRSYYILERFLSRTPLHFHVADNLSESKEKITSDILKSKTAQRTAGRKEVDPP
jgi:hypothetical protein